MCYQLGQEGSGYHSVLVYDGQWWFFGNIYFLVIQNGLPQGKLEWEQLGIGLDLFRVSLSGKFIGCGILSFRKRVIWCSSKGQQPLSDCLEQKKGKKQTDFEHERSKIWWRWNNLYFQNNISGCQSSEDIWSKVQGWCSMGDQKRWTSHHRDTH